MNLGIGFCFWRAISRCIAHCCLLWVAVCPLLSSAEERPLVVSTTGMVGDLVRVIAEDDVRREVLMGPGVDPHLYKATFGDLQKLEKAALILYNGLHLEGKMGEIFEKLARRRKVVAIAEVIPEAELRSPPEFEGNFDPHIWFDIQLWIKAGDRAATSLGELVPEKASLFSQRWQEERKRLGELDRWAKQEVQKIPAAQRVLVTAHDAFGYFGRAYGVEVQALQGISTASEFGLQDVTRLASLLVERKIKAIFVESSVPRRFLESVQEGAKAKGFNVNIGGTLFSDSLGDPGTDEGTYAGMFRYNVRTIVEALR